jgi:amidase
MATVTDLCFLDATELVRLMRTKKLSAREVMTAHLEQIARVNPQVNAIVTLHADEAMQAAQRTDDALARGEKAGPLHGLPVAHKDLFVTKGMRTTFGSRIYRDLIPAQDAIVVERQRNAGAISIGKTNTPEFGAGSQTFNEVFGATRNPYDLTKTCGGSSGGAAVALACGMVPLADGSDLGGSLRNPANFCNVVGLRPSIGRVPNWPTEDAWNTLSVAGPMARTVEDVALFLSVIAGPDTRDPVALAEDGARFAPLPQRDFTGTRVAWSANLGGLPVEPAVTAVLGSQRGAFEALGCAVDEASPDLSGASEVFYTQRGVMFATAFGELIAKHRELFKDTIVWNTEYGQQRTATEIGRAAALRSQIFARMHTFMQRYEFLIAPVNQVAPFPVEQPYPTQIDGVAMNDYMTWMQSCFAITVTGHPAISVPCGFTPDGLPVGVQIVGRYRDELGLLQFARAFERATHTGRRRPAFVSA